MEVAVVRLGTMHMTIPFLILPPFCMYHQVRVIVSQEGPWRLDLTVVVVMDSFVMLAFWAGSRSCLHTS